MAILTGAGEYAKEFGECEWVKNWAGKWSLLTCSYFGDQYTRSIAADLGFCLPTAVLFVRQGASACFFKKSELQEFGSRLAEKASHDKAFVFWLCSEWKNRGDFMRGVVSRLTAKAENAELSQKDYNEFIEGLYYYVAPHVAGKRIVDFLPPNLLQEFLPALQDARVRTEPVYAETEAFMAVFAAQVGRKTSEKSELVLCLLSRELADYFAHSRLPPSSELETRFQAAALVFNGGKADAFFADQAFAIEAALHAFAADGELTGSTAFKGVARGIARLVSDPRDEKLVFNEGDVLVTAMTRPEFLPLMKKASAFITDAGGMLSHAAIVARELRKPCVVGTEKATKVLKTGDFVEVDADKGVVRRLPTPK